ncbi:MAG: VOC family protein [Brevibacterium aurantiacum]|uniref:Glyoxalase-like domain-containing protein n=2 Tax=Brevibacterium TaxID=1696 RepID=A0A2A3ZNX0_BREAU|nr:MULTISPECIES: VOC family protein [Brevibacterium]AZL04917.1 VOC family protein [Brevibacterium aurantiacum]MDN5549414.1 VOC family protein [Brevibacterium sp.]MDN5593041.1 VOC family protein [Brevibacterium sp.]MDN5607465.1 VOC family protein [Brevibacterium sp.]MDN5660084.1 VOC family protein [Brevibacterium aurantiacum]
MLLPWNFDHLVIAVPNLAESVEQYHNILGVEPIPGGAHPGLGTANALLGLEFGDESGDEHRDIYLEILGPDPEQDPELAVARLAGITRPTVQRWAIHPDDFDGLVTSAARASEPPVDLGEVHDMTRRTPAGTLLEWRLTRRTPLALGGIQPFLIDWQDSPHPARQAMPSVHLERFWALSPDVDTTSRVLRSLGATIEVEAGVTETLHATLKGPGGSWTI